jgi:hypothetical protein
MIALNTLHLVVPSTRALWPADPAPQHWPAPRFDARSLASLTADNAARRAARAEVDLRTVRRMVAECAAMVSL